MLQDITYGRLENEYRNLSIQPEDLVLCFRNGEILMGRDSRGLLALPTYRQAEPWSACWDRWEDSPWRYAFRMMGVNYFLWMGQAGACPEDSFFYHNVRQFRDPASKDTSFAMDSGWHHYRTNRSSRYCGDCGCPTDHDGKEPKVRCPSCGQMIFPRINPAVIVAVTDGDRLVLTKYAGRSYSSYALIAGFTEFGETPEQTVRREVMEEVGLAVKNIRYYKSQPWGIDGNLLLGFFCDLDGDDTIRLDQQELSVAEWHQRSSLPVQDDGITLTREMIGVFGRGMEPK